MSKILKIRFTMQIAKIRENDPNNMDVRYRLNIGKV